MPEYTVTVAEEVVAVLHWALEVQRRREGEAPADPAGMVQQVIDQQIAVWRRSQAEELVAVLEQVLTDASPATRTAAVDIIQGLGQVDDQRQATLLAEFRTKIHHGPAVPPEPQEIDEATQETTIRGENLEADDNPRVR